MSSSMRTAPAGLLDYLDELSDAGAGLSKDHAFREAELATIGELLIGALRSLHAGLTQEELWSMISRRLNAPSAKSKATKPSPQPESRRLSLRLTLMKRLPGIPGTKVVASLLDETGSVVGEVSRSSNQTASLVAASQCTIETLISLPSTSRKPTSTGFTSSCPECGDGGINPNECRLANRHPELCEARWSKAELLTLLRRSELSKGHRTFAGEFLETL
jgi:hypothetical protein